MMNQLRRASLYVTKRSGLHLFVTVMLILSAACQARTGKATSEARGIVVVNAPATGEVRRVLVREGMTVEEGSPIIEIAVQSSAPNTPQSRVENPQAQAGSNFREVQAEIKAARDETVRTGIEVQRLTALVASGNAPQAQLDGARALYQRAQQRLQQAQASEQRAQTNLITARRQAQNSPLQPPVPSEQIVTARAASAGAVSAINVQVGARVLAGQPLTTLRAN